jgi:hypothetical protein
MVPSDFHEHCMHCDSDMISNWTHELVFLSSLRTAGILRLMSFGSVSVELGLLHMAGRFSASSARDVCTVHEVCWYDALNQHNCSMSKSVNRDKVCRAIESA